MEIDDHFSVNTNMTHIQAQCNFLYECVRSTSLFIDCHTEFVLHSFWQICFVPHQQTTQMHAATVVFVVVFVVVAIVVKVGVVVYE